MNQNNNELYHYGVLGMKWGHHKAKSTTISERKAKRFEKKRIQNEMMVKDNDKRVKTYGKKMVKFGDAVGIAGVAYGMVIGNQVIKSIGKSSMKSIANNPNRSNAALHVASALTVAGMSAVTVSSLKNINKARKDMKLTDEYDYRQYVKKQNNKNK